MTIEARVAFILSQIACFYAQLEGMKAENKEREKNGLAPAWDADAFFSLPANYLITHNQVIEYLRG